MSSPQTRPALSMLVLSPDRPSDDLALSNDFSYAMDSNGARCPFTSHIRIVNRRDDELTDAAEAAAVAGATGYQAPPGDHTNGERDRSWDGDVADPRTGPPADEFG